MSTLIAVAPNKMATGFEPSAGKTNPPEVYEVLELCAALRREYDTDAHCVTYIVDGAERQVRINKLGLVDFPRRVVVTAFFVDLDNPGHAPWTDESRAAARAQEASSEEAKRAVIYDTGKGRRLARGLVTPVTPEEAERYLAMYHQRLIADGFKPDAACMSWNGHFRMPNVRRDGLPWRTPYLSLENHQLLDVTTLGELPEVEEPSADEPRKKAPRKPPVSFAADVPEMFLPMVETIGQSVRIGVSSDFHAMYLAMAGALVMRRVMPELIPAIVQRIAMRAGSIKPDHHQKSARDTVDKHRRGERTTGMPALLARWPLVADALYAATAFGHEAGVRAQAAVETDAPSAADAHDAIVEALRKHGDGLEMFCSGCGAGKTHAACVVAAERQQTGARLGSRTSICVSTTKLAEQIAADLTKAGHPVMRLRGVTAGKGESECKKKHVALQLVRGGQSVEKLLCRGCEYELTCLARLGYEGDPHAKIIVAPHEMLERVSALTGKTGLLMIDEPPPAIESKRLNQSDLGNALDLIQSSFTNAAPLAPALSTLSTWLTTAKIGEVIASDKLIAPFPCESPVVSRSAISAMYRHPAFAKSLGDAAEVIMTVYRAVSSSQPVKLRVEERAKVRTLVLTLVNHGLALALNREGSVAALDANADANQSTYAKIVGYEPKLHRFHVADGAPIARTLAMMTGATRTGWIPRGRVSLENGLERAIDRAIDWVREDASTITVGIITMKVIELLLRGAQGEAVDAEWSKLGQIAATLAAARERIGPSLEGLTIIFGHYGGIRGLDHMKHVDALVTLGDPWQNLDDVRDVVAHFGLDEEPSARAEMLCRAELEQAHGRLRAPHRARPGRALHVGRILPGGSGWTNDKVDIRPGVAGAPKAATCMPQDEVSFHITRLRGVRPAARAIGVSHQTILRYRDGAPVPTEVAVRLRAAAGPTTPIATPVDEASEPGPTTLYVGTSSYQGVVGPPVASATEWALDADESAA